MHAETSGLIPPAMLASELVPLAWGTATDNTNRNLVTHVIHNFNLFIFFFVIVQFIAFPIIAVDIFRGRLSA